MDHKKKFNFRILNNLVSTPHHAACAFLMSCFSRSETLFTFYLYRGSVVVLGFLVKHILFSNIVSGTNFCWKGKATTKNHIFAHSPENQDFRNELSFPPKIIGTSFALCCKKVFAYSCYKDWIFHFYL